MKKRQPLHAELPYREDSCVLFDAIANRSWAVFLDSGSESGRQGRYDIISCDPYQTIVTHAGTTICTDRTGRHESSEDPFALLKKRLPEPSDSLLPPPFHGGALGCFSYDLGRYLERLPDQAAHEDGAPDMALGIYDWALVVDHQEKCSWIASAGHDSSTAKVWPDLLALFSTPPPPAESAAFRVTGPLRSNLNRQQYARAFSKIQRYIREGDCYQVNLAQRFSIPTEGNPWLAYKQLRKLSSAPFSAYMNLPGMQVLSNSPERFLKVQERKVESQPIKGTIARLKDPQEDARQVETLRQSRKDQAENLMIVDLLRNDLSKSCEPSSVKVPKLFDIESFATVHHLVSTVEGVLQSDKSAIELLRGSFPGGSITGAPKLRAMEIIEELEPHRRGVYCGAVGYIGFDGNMDTNIAIRTLTHINGQLRFSAGGGIVADSDMALEYQETYDKVAAILDVLRQLS